MKGKTMKKVYHETFEDFPLGEFPYDKAHSALGEYHHLMPEGYMGNFYDPINNHQWRSMEGSWLVVNYDGKNYMEQNRGYNVKGHFSDVTSMLVLNSDDFKNYILETKVMLYSKDYETGIAFDYIHNRKYMAVVIGTDYVELYKKDQVTRTSIKKVAYKVESLIDYKIRIVKNNKVIKVYLNEELILETLYEITLGKVALMSQNACRYSYLDILIDDQEESRITEFKTNETKNIESKQANYGKIEVIHKIDLKGMGSGRQMRTAIVDGKPIFVFAQHQKRMYRDSFAHISCISVFDFNGTLLWQEGKPINDMDNGPISCDLPFQISDINNDGKLELIYIRNFEIYIVELLTGKILKKHKTPYIKNIETIEPNYPYDYLNADGMRVADFTHKGYQGDLMVKDRYRNVFGLDENFNILFKYHHKNTGHFPYVYDFDEDGNDELFIGYDMTKNGEVIWSLPYNSDHTDEIIFEALDCESEKVFILASGNEGFNIVSKEGEILHSIPVGHAQRISLAKYVKELDGYQVCVTSFWGANGIIYTFDKDMNRLSEKEFIGNGNVITPINYDNDLQNLILMNTSPKYGGLYNGYLEKMVEFPDDGHPTLASEAFDIDGDGLDEILTWDMNSLWIYKTTIIKDKKHEYRRYPENAFSNYRGEYLIPKKK
ncbi:conserved hypothetical protein [Alteracholeplasma palmae J233]|uniref:Uncharacterized protein n=1 Tax=Alteracholeplasma palmae (strain ATCC 49389 / J233) TaxID=1318466 RepID=U4KJV1_ALTPJ|nr:hypothetical protein [Alteracholeplasma palmae]CCV63737.1 conserved hypothetical protein [Alteracholeplasma palmae J233]